MRNRSATREILDEIMAYLSDLKDGADLDFSFEFYISDIEGDVNYLRDWANLEIHRYGHINFSIVIPYETLYEVMYLRYEALYHINKLEKLRFVYPKLRWEMLDFYRYMTFLDIK